MKYNVSFTLRELRESKGINQTRLAEVLEISQSMYAAVEAGQRKPTIDTLFRLASLYGTSMDFVYHAYYRQHIIWNQPEHELKYALRRTHDLDARYLREHFRRADKEPELPAAIIYDENPPQVIPMIQPWDDPAQLTGLNPYPERTAN
jgi:transcriptional regulator with XRE-family HTH domain